MKTLDELATRIRDVNRANGWNVFKTEEWGNQYKIPGILALIHSEVSEALEAFRRDDGENFTEELADILIRVLDVAGGMTDQFQEVVEAKIQKNSKRGHRYGGKRL